MRRVLTLLLLAGLLLGVFPLTTAAAPEFGPAREMLIPVIDEHADMPQFRYYLDLENNRLTNDPTQADVYFGMDSKEGRPYIYVAGYPRGDTGQRKVAKTGRTFEQSETAPPDLRLLEQIQLGNVVYVITRSGLAAKVEIVALNERVRARTDIDTVQIRYAVQGATASGDPGDSGRVSATFGQAVALELTDIAKATEYVDLDTLTITSDPRRGEFYFSEQQIFHTPGGSAGLQRLGSELGFSRTATFFKTGWEHGVPAFAGMSHVFKSVTGKYYKVKIQQTVPYKLTLLVAPEGPAPVAGYEHLAPGHLAAYTVVAVAGNGDLLSLDLLAQRPVPQDRAHVLVSSGMVRLGPSSRGISRIHAVDDLATSAPFGMQEMPAKPGDLFAIATKAGPVVRIRVIQASGASLAVQVLPALAMGDFFKNTPLAGTRMLLPLELSDPEAARLDTDPLDVLAQALPPIATLDGVTGGIYVPAAGLGPESRLGYLGGALFVTNQAGIRIDALKAAAAGGGTAADLKWDGQSLLAGSTVKGITALGSTPAYQVQAPHGDGQPQQSMNITGRATYLVARTDGPAALIRVDEHGVVPEGWVRLHVYYQPDGGRHFFRPGEEPPPPPPPPPPPVEQKTVITLQVNNRVAAVNERQVTLDTAPQIIGGRTMVPLRFIAESLGADVKYQDETKTITIALGTTQVVMVVNNPVASINGRPVTLDSPPTVVGGRTLVPVRFVSEGLGAKVGWDDQTKTVTITQ